MRRLVVVLVVLGLVPAGAMVASADSGDVNAAKDLYNKCVKKPEHKKCP